MSEVIDLNPMPIVPVSAPSKGAMQFANFSEIMFAAEVFSKSTMVPEQYRRLIEIKQNGKTLRWEENHNAVANCLVALNMAQRTGYDPLMIMQNLFVIEGRPAWSSQYVIAAINGCGRFTSLNWETKDLGEKTVTVYNKFTKSNESFTIQDKSCIAYATEKATGNVIRSTPITMQMAIEEGWYQKKGSKWQTMPEQMLRYRSAAFFGRAYVPDILMGIYPKDELLDFIDVTPEPVAAPAQQPQPQAPTPQAAPMPEYDIKAKLDEISKAQNLEAMQGLINDITELKAQNERGEINLSEKNLDELRAQWILRRKIIITNILMPKIQAATLETADDVRAELYAAQKMLGDDGFNTLSEILDGVLNNLVADQEAAPQDDIVLDAIAEGAA